MNKTELSSTERTALCDAAKAAWSNAGPRTKVVAFSWNGRRYRSRLTSFRMLVDDAAGNPVACRYH